MYKDLTSKGCQDTCTFLVIYKCTRKLTDGQKDRPKYDIINPWRGRRNKKNNRAYNVRGS